jgi:hypothetical protein
MKSAEEEEQWAYVGEWAVEEPVVLKGMEGDTGLVVKNAAAHHAISAKFPTKIDNTGKTLVVQYEVKLQSKFTVTLVVHTAHDVYCPPCMLISYLTFSRPLQMASSAVVPTSSFFARMPLFTRRSSPMPPPT